MIQLGEGEIVIKDACILIDLCELNLLTEFFQLKLIVFTTPQVVSEIISEEQLREISPFLENGNLLIDSSGELESIDELNQKYSGLSFVDCSVLELAERINAAILSSDGSLRKISIERKIEVKGTIWILEELNNKGIISSETILKKLEEYKQINKRAPLLEIEKLINKFSD